MTSTTSRYRRGGLAAFVALALLTAACSDDSGDDAASDTTSHSGSSTGASSAEFDLHGAMRAAWEEHANLTVRAIVSAVEGTPETDAVVASLLENQERIGDAIKPYYGDEAGTALTDLLKEHINTAAATLGAAISGDEAALSAASDTFYANGEDIAVFLSEANPENWPLEEMEQMMTHHLDQVVELVVLQIQGDYEAALDLYAGYIDHVLVGMADVLTAGIVAQFPDQFES